jgi:hypothetical protein
MDSAARPIATLYLVSGYCPSLTEEGRAVAVDAAWPVFGGRDPRALAARRGGRGRCGRVGSWRAAGWTAA